MAGTNGSDKLRRVAACIVSFLDLDGVRHSVEVQADGLYEAAVLGLGAFRKHDLNPGGLTEFEVEVRSSIKHMLPVKKIEAWLERGFGHPRRRLLKNAYAPCCECLQDWWRSGSNEQLGLTHRFASTVSF